MDSISRLMGWIILITLVTIGTIAHPAAGLFFLAVGRKHNDETDNG